MKSIVLAGVACATLALSGVASAATVQKVAVLDGVQETPDVATPAHGCGRFIINTTTNELTFRIAFSGLVGAETAAHIHGPADPGMNAGVLFALPGGNPKVGTWVYPEAMEGDILAGKTYVNIHSAANPGGEIRGQIVDLVARIDGAQAGTGSPGQGVGLFNIDRCNNNLTFHIEYAGLTGAETGAHIHGFSLHTVNSGVQFGLPGGSPKIGSWTYPEATEGPLLDGLTYVNIHSTTAPGGEIRGQITRFVAPVDGGQAVPPFASPGHGCGLLAFENSSNTFSYYVAHQNLTAAATAAHIHGFAPPGINAGVLINIGAVSPAIGIWPVAAVDVPQILANRTYVNVHTAAAPGGEIRGQIEFPPPDCTGDTNCDGVVDVSDLVNVVLKWGTNDPNADTNGDGTVDVTDLVNVILGWGDCP